MTKTINNFSAEVRERAIQMVGEHRADYASEWLAMTSIAGKTGCTAETTAGAATRRADDRDQRYGPAVTGID